MLNVYPCKDIGTRMDNLSFRSCVALSLGGHMCHSHVCEFGIKIETVKINDCLNLNNTDPASKVKSLAVYTAVNNNKKQLFIAVQSSFWAMDKRTPWVLRNDRAVFTNFFNP